MTHLQILTMKIKMTITYIIFLCAINKYQGLMISMMTKVVILILFKNKFRNSKKRFKSKNQVIQNSMNFNNMIKYQNLLNLQKKIDKLIKLMQTQKIILNRNLKINKSKLIPI